MSELVSKMLFTFVSSIRKAKKISHLEYLLFGRSQELFLAHIISAPAPDFDQILAVKIDNRGLADQDFQHGLRISFPNRANSANMRLKAGEHLVCEFRPIGAAEASKLTLETGRDFYCEQGELAEVAGAPFRVCRP